MKTRQLDASERFFSDGGGFIRLSALDASLLDYRGGSLTLRRRDDEALDDFRQRRLFARAYLEAAEDFRRRGDADDELTALSRVAAAVRGDSPWP
jgi:hypothetical protein